MKALAAMASSLARIAFLSVSIVALLLGLLPASARADNFTPDQRREIEGIVRDYLVHHPEALIDAIQAAEEKLKSDAKDKAANALKERRREVFDDPQSPIAGNPKGDATLVEFFDYRCPYCKQVQPSLEKLLGDDRQLRLVYKEFPVLGPASELAAHAALAARKQGKYDAFHRAMMAAKGTIDDMAIYAVAGSVGLDVERLKQDMKSPDIDKQLKANFALADALEINGTPAFVVGDEIVPGAVSLDALKQLIATARGK
jgi:protein-disulfide isomerase